MIEQLEVSNYRSLRKVTMRPGPINCLIGANGSGKTNLLEALELLKAAASERLAEFVNQRQGFRSLQWFGSTEGELTFKVRLRVGATSNAALTMRYELRLAASGGSYTVAEEYLKPFRTTPGKPTEYIKNLGGQGNLYNDERAGPDKVPSKADPGPGPRERSWATSVRRDTTPWPRVRRMPYVPGRCFRSLALTRGPALLRGRRERLVSRRGLNRTGAISRTPSGTCRRERHTSLERSSESPVQRLARLRASRCDQWWVRTSGSHALR